MKSIEASQREVLKEEIIEEMKTVKVEKFQENRHKNHCSKVSPERIYIVTNVLVG